MNKKFQNQFFYLICFITFSFLGLAFPFYGNAENFIRGINYDPVHSIAFAHGSGTDNAELMQQAIFNDLDKLKELSNRKGFKITHIKTFFSQYQSFNNRENINMADVIYHWNQANPDAPLKLALGVYQFRPGVDGCRNENECEFWTQGQMNAAKEALEKYNANQIPLIDSIIIGNENLDTKSIESRLVRDINEIKKFLKDSDINDVSVGTAQMAHSVFDMYNGNNYQKVLEAADFIGVNFYPFWSRVPYGQEGVTAKSAFEKDWQNLKNSKKWGTKPIIETEEGWPSAGLYDASLESQQDYFYYWYNGHVSSNEFLRNEIDEIVQVSYFFALNDKLPGQGVESHWGLFSADNSTNALDNLNTGGKKLASNLVFPNFLNYIGADLSTNVVYDKNNLHSVIVNACTEDEGKGICYPLYGFNSSGKVSELSVNTNSWNSTKNGFTTFSPGINNELMIDTSLEYYKSLLVILDDHENYPAICTISSESLQKLNSGTNIPITWPKEGIPQPCVL